jgi:hypothetical protein
MFVPTLPTCDYLTNCAMPAQRRGSLISPLDKEVPSKITAPHSSIQAVTLSPKNNTP